MSPQLHKMQELWFTNSDISIDVLSRLPTKTLLGLKCVSKEWQQLISDRSFVKHQLKSTEPVSGFFFQEKFQWCDDDIESITYIPVNMGSAGVQCTIFDFLPESVVLMAISNGLICCRSSFPSPYPVIYVCNPVNKEWLSLTWPVPNKRDAIGLVFDPFKDPIDKSTSFKLVQVHPTVNCEEYSYFTFNVYSSKTGMWSRSAEVCQCDHNLYKNKGVFVGGILYFLTDGDQILMFDVVNDLSWLVAVPFPLSELDSIPEVCIGESEGRLHYVLLSENGLQMWILEDHFEFTWVLKCSIALNELEGENPKYLSNIPERVAGRLTTDMTSVIDPLALKDGLLLMRVASTIYLLNFETRKLEYLCSLSVLGPNSFSPIVLPYFPSLVPLGPA